VTKPGLFSCFSLFYIIVFFVFLMHDYLCSVSLGLLYVFVVISAGFMPYSIIFLPCGFFFFFFFFVLFFPRLFSAVTDCMSTILPHMVWP